MTRTESTSPGAPGSPGSPGGANSGHRLHVTDRARDALARLGHDHGPQALLLCWPGGAVALPPALYVPGRFDVIIGHVARCPIYVDVRQLGCTTGSAVLDVRETVWDRDWPLLRLRPAAVGAAIRVSEMTR